MRSYAWASAKRGLESEASSSALGQVWLLLQPAITIAILWVIFGVVLNLSRGSDNYIAFLTVGILSFLYNQRGIMRGSNALVNSAAIVISLSIPRAVIVVSQILHALASYRYALIVAAISLPLMGSNPRIGWLVMIPIVLLQTGFNFGASLLLAGPAARFTDLRLALEYIFQILFYVSGVFIPLSFFLDGENANLLLKLSTLNPFYCFAELSRWAMLGIEPPNSSLMIAVACAVSIGLSVVGLLHFWKNEVKLSNIQTLEA